jgi:hypothetical protein
MQTVQRMFCLTFPADATIIQQNSSLWFFCRLTPAVICALRCV